MARPGSPGLAAAAVTGKVAHAKAELAADSSAQAGPAMVAARPGTVRAPAGDKYKDMRGYEVRQSLLHDLHCLR